MTRRKLVALVAVFVFVLVGIVGMSTLLYLTHTEGGRERLRSTAQPFLARKFKGANIYIGKVSGIGLTELTIDTIAIRDKRGELLLSTGRVTLAYDPRDIIDQRIYIRWARIEHPYVHLIEHENGVWNFREVFATPSGPPEQKSTKSRGFGDYLVVDSARMRDGTFLLTMPWRPDSSLKGAARDSVIRVHLENPQKAVSRTVDGFGRLYAWRNMHGLLTHMRLADPDSDKAFGKEFHIDSLAADEYEPTFRFRNVRGNARVLGDSVWFDVPHFNLPASKGYGHGKVWWGSDRPVRLDIAVRGDSVSLDDVNWVYPDLPRTGGGTLDLFIKNDPRRDHENIIDYKLSKMDVRSTKSHLTGDMSFGVGAPVLLVRNVDMKADPIDFDLLRTLAGKPFPYDWQGQIFGAAKGRGGPLTNFVLEEAHGVFRDAHVPGAVSRFSGNGELDILYPAFTAFHNFHVDVASLDLRTIEFLNPAFPRLGGIVSGVATLDSSWLDMRFSNADVIHRDGPGEPSRFTGSGRVTYDTLMIYDVALEAQPLSLTMIARSYPNPLRGLVSGPIRVKGQAPDLEISTTLQNSHAALSFDGRVDLDSVGGYGARGRGQFSTPNLSGLLSTNNLLVGPLGVHYDVDLAGISAAEPSLVRGTAALDVEKTLIDSIRWAPSRLRFRFADGEMHIDSARVRTDAATIELSGGIGLPKTAPRDSILFSINVDSLGGLRPYLPQPDTTLLGAARTAPDSLSGSVNASGRLTGTLDALNVVGKVTGRNLYRKRDRAERVTIDVDLHNVLANYSGSATGRMDSVAYAGIAFDTIAGSLTIADSAHRKFSASAVSRSGPVVSASGDWSTSGDTSFVRLDSFGLNIDNARWRLAAPSHFVFDTVGTRLDSLLLRNADSGSVFVRANIPATGLASADLRALHIPLRDVGVLTQVNDTIAGSGNLTASVTGTRARPRVEASAELSGIRWYGVDVERVRANAVASNARIAGDVEIVRAGKTAVTANASLPIDVSLFGAKVRDDSLSGVITAQPTDLGLLNAFLKRSKTTLSGQLSANVTVAGTWLKPTLNGRVSVRDGSANLNTLAGISIVDLNGDANWTRSAGGQDSVHLRLTGQGGGKNGGSVALDGYAKNLLQPRQAQPLRFALGADAFHAFNKRTLAELYISTTALDSTGKTKRDSLRLTGSVQSPVLTGNVNVDRGAIFLADRDLARKQSVSLLEDTLTGPEETRSKMLSTLMSNLQIPNSTITLGDVRLRSAEASVRLTGSLRLNTSTARSTRTSASTGQLLPQLSLEGALRTAGGTYNLNLGLAQREFQVLNDGTVTFDGPWQNPNLDIRAQYSVRRAGDRDLGVIVNLNGPLIPYPGIELTSNAGYDISQSDLVSYLITGKPGFDFGANPQAAQVVSSFLGPTLSAIAADKLRAGLGSAIDVVRFQFGSTNTSAGAATNATSGQNWSQYLYGSTIDVEQQFKNVWLSANVGFCQFTQTQANFNALNTFGAKAEYRFKPDLSLKLSYDPSAASRVCTGQPLITGFQQTPWQVGLSLLHTWRF